MGHSQKEKALNNERILAAAATRIRREGLNGFSISDVMSDVGLTHGTFYAHFKTRDDLIAAALQKALQESAVVYDENAATDIGKVITEYLGKAHRDHPELGCAVAALASEITRADKKTRSVMDAHLEKYIERVSEILKQSENISAIPVVCTMIGAVTLSRLVENRELSDRILREAAEYILSLVGTNKTENA